MDNPIKPMSDEDRARLRVISEKLKGIELFPKHLDEVNAENDTTSEEPIVPHEVLFNQDTQIFRDEVKIISEKISEFLAQERKILDNKLTDKKDINGN